MDFALEFHVGKHGVTYIGISVFATSSTGAYTGNYVSGELCLKRRIPEALQGHLSDVCKKLQRHLQNVYSQGYSGPLGVDMTMGNICVSLRSQLRRGAAIYRLRPVGETTEATLVLTPYAKRIEAVLQTEEAE